MKATKAGKREELMDSANKILDEYNAGNMSKEIRDICLKPISISLREAK